MDLSGPIQESIVALALFGRDPDVRAIAGLVRPADLDPHCRTVYAAALDYHERHKTPAGPHARALLAAVRDRASKNDRELYATLNSRIWACRKVNASFVLENAEAYAQDHRLRAAMAQAIDRLEAEPTSRGVAIATDIVRKATEPRGVSVGLGTDLGNPADVGRILAGSDELDVLKLGIDPLDLYRAGPWRGGLWTLLAGPSTGKTHSLIYLGRRAVVQGWRVAHYTVELSEDKTSMRYLQAFHRWTTRQQQVQVSRLVKDDFGMLVDVSRQDIDRHTIKALDDKQIRRAKRFSAATPVIVKGYPAGTLRVQDIDAHLGMLERHGFRPDLVIVDYVDEMYVDPKNMRLDIGAIYTALRGLAQSRNCAVATVSQTSKEAENVRWVTRDKASEAWLKIMKADTALTYSQTKLEKKLGLARLMLVRHRDDGGLGTRVAISQSYDDGRFVVDWARMSDDSYFSMLDREKGGSDE